MAKSTGPVLLTGGISFGNTWLATGSVDLKILVATGIAAGGLALVEQIPGMAPVASGIAWIAFVTLMFTRIGGKPSPADTLQRATGL